MKVFWSWQSDTPGKIGRHFVRSVLENVIEDLKAPHSLDESVRDLHLDHDRKGVSGSPDLVATILSKIRNSAVFVADVTLVGASSTGKRMINSNVAIEFGFALGTLGDQSILMIMNEHYGRREELPFDLRHKAGPVLYRLSPNATAAELKDEASRLASVLKKALRDFVGSSLVQPSAEALHTEQASTTNRGIYFEPNQSLAALSSGTKVSEFHCASRSVFYLRLIPVLKQRALKRSEAIDVIKKSNVAPLGHDHGRPYSHNSYGAIAFALDKKQEDIVGVTQVFSNRELWGLVAVDLYMKAREDDGANVSVDAFENDMYHAVFEYMVSAHDHLRISGPLLLEAGGIGVKGLGLLITTGPFSGRLYGPILDETFFTRSRIESTSKEEVEGAVLEIFDALFDAAGSRRPKNLFNFPNRR